jgi:hypothetical protein
MPIAIPGSLRDEHVALHHSLVALGREPGELGESARLVSRLLAPHAEREEQFALPPLGLLGALARGEADEKMAPVFIHTDWMRKNYETMLAEHRMILAALERLLAAARAAGRDDVAGFAEKLAVHARLEEEVLYPASLLVGEYLRLRLGRLAYAATTA